MVGSRNLRLLDSLRGLRWGVCVGGKGVGAYSVRGRSREVTADPVRSSEKMMRYIATTEGLLESRGTSWKVIQVGPGMKSLLSRTEH